MTEEQNNNLKELFSTLEKYNSRWTETCEKRNEIDKEMSAQLSQIADVQERINSIIIEGNLPNELVGKHVRITENNCDMVMMFVESVETSPVFCSLNGTYVQKSDKKFDVTFNHSTYTIPIECLPEVPHFVEQKGMMKVEIIDKETFDKEVNEYLTECKNKVIKD